ncbi:hypothetical protein IWQ60_008694 [Tieghemiomyces parasiticus]|uniref:Tetratricopeptide repeat protein n=1 Tax=Tieghemiomyces parasiticus TaxID=78921 RepID=A0A9W7ZQY9_9FUNG|nr:hypothetical protein IWQ60_008694 [Tieghemiomyces parasiticus]
MAFLRHTRHLRSARIAGLSGILTAPAGALRLPRPASVPARLTLAAPAIVTSFYRPIATTQPTQLRFPQLKWPNRNRLYQLRSSSIRAEATRGNFTYLTRFVLFFVLSGCVVTTSFATGMYFMMKYLDEELAPVDRRIPDPAHKYLMGAVVREQILPSAASARHFVIKGREYLLETIIEQEAKACEDGAVPDPDRLTETDPAVIELTMRVADYLARDGDDLAARDEYQKVWDKYVTHGDTFWQAVARTDRYRMPTAGPGLLPVTVDPVTGISSTRRLVTLVRLANQFGAVSTRLGDYDAALTQLGLATQWYRELTDTVSPADAAIQTREHGRWVTYERDDLRLLELRTIYLLGDVYARRSELDLAYDLYQEALKRFQVYNQVRQGEIASGTLRLDYDRYIPSHWATFNKYAFGNRLDLSGLFYPPTASLASPRRHEYRTSSPAGQDIAIDIVRRILSRDLKSIIDPNREYTVDPWACRDAYLMDRLGEVSYGRGNRTEAERWFRSALRIAESQTSRPIGLDCTATVLSHLATLAERQGQPQEAHTYWQRALDTAEVADMHTLADKCRAALDRIAALQRDQARLTSGKGGPEAAAPRN